MSWSRPSRGELADQALDRPQQDAGVDLGPAAGVGEVTGDPAGREREQRRRRQGGLDDRGGAADGAGLRGGDPLREGVDVGERRHVGGHDPQGRAGAGVRAVQLAEEPHLAVVQARRGRHDGGSPGEQATDDGGRDGALAGAGDDGDLAGVGAGLVAHRVVGDASRGARAARRRRCARPTSRAWPATMSPAPTKRGVDVVACGDAGDVLAGAGPAVVDQQGAALVERRCGEVDPVAAELGLDPGEHLCVVARRLDRRRSVVESEPAEQVTGRAGEHAVGTGDLAGDLGEGGGVDGRLSPAGARQVDRDAVARGDRLHAGVDGCVDVGGGREPGQGAEVAAAHAGPVAGRERELGQDVLGPAGAELPGVGDALGDGGLLLAGGAEHLLEVVGEGLAQHRAERLVAAGQAGDLRRQRRDVGLRGAVDGAEPELATEVDEELVAAGGHTVAERLDGVGGADLVETQLGPPGDEQLRAVGGAEGQVVRTRSGRGGRRGLRGFGGRLGRGLGGLGHRLVVLDRLFVGAEQHTGVALGVEHLDGAAEGPLDGRELQGRRGEVGHGGGRADADLDDALDPEATIGPGGEHQVLGLDPAHRAGELPGQELDQDEAAQLAGALRPGVEVGQHRVERAVRCELGDLGEEVAVEAERPRHEVGHVSPDQRVRIDRWRAAAPPGGPGSPARRRAGRGSGTARRCPARG